VLGKRCNLPHVALMALLISCMGQITLASLSIPMLTVGDPNNAPDPATGYGSVPYTYQIEKFDVTVSQYVQILNSVAVNSDLY
jgi:hypothetical protein